VRDFRAGFLLDALTFTGGRSSGRRPTVVLADDHPMVMEGLRKLLEPEFEVVETATNGRALLEIAARQQPDLVITDISMSGIDGIEATRRLEVIAPGTRVLILSVHAEPSWVRAAFDAGACGYVTKTSAPEEVETAVREVLEGRFYVSSQVARAAILPPQEGAQREAAETLTPRELEIIRLLGAGLGNKEIASRLGVAVTTVRTHLNSVYDKLGSTSRVELALFAAQASGATL
jgi:DNA-binding NarL/FixJ family response regulator